MKFEFIPILIHLQFTDLNINTIYIQPCIICKDVNKNDIIISCPNCSKKYHHSCSVPAFKQDIRFQILHMNTYC